MSTPESSAQAYDRLARVSAQAEFAEKISFDFRKLKRAVETLRSDLFLLHPSDDAAVAKLEEIEAFAVQQRAVYRAIADDKTTRAIELNERIQNGVYNG